MKNLARVTAVIFLYAVIFFNAILLFRPSYADAVQPNIILISTDDMGWGDFCGNNDLTNPINVKLCGSGGPGTPNLKSLAESGVTLSNFYTPTPICSPSRAALMTGQDPRRPQIYSALGGVTGEKFLDQNFTTIATILRDAANYNTAIIGKWHLGWDDRSDCTGDSCNCPNGGCNSWDHGFQYNYVLPLGIGQAHNGFCLAENYNSNDAKWTNVNEILNFTSYKQYSEQYGASTDDGRIDACNPNDFLPDNTTTNPKKANQVSFSSFSGGKSLTRVFTDKAIINFINNDLDPSTVFHERVRDFDNKNQPFFLYLAYPAPHAPLYIHLNQSQEIAKNVLDISLISYLKCAKPDLCTPKEIHQACETKSASDLAERQKCEIQALYPYAISGIDYNVGQLLEFLKGPKADITKLNPAYHQYLPTEDILSNTVVLFTSDNGPYGGDAAQYPDYGRTGGLRGSKKFTYEGGVRVPFIASGLGVLKNIKLNQAADMMDILPTLVTMTGGQIAPSTTNADNVVADFTSIQGGKKIEFKKPDGTDISSVLGNGTVQNKNIQISWFGNFPICIKDASGACITTEDSHPFASRSYSLDKNAYFKLLISSDPPTPTSILPNGTKIINPPSIRKISKPVELYNVHPKYSPVEKENDNLCLSTSLMDPTGKALNCCQSSNCTSTKCNCGDGTNSDTTWDALYGPIVQDLWKKAEYHDKQVRPLVYK